jgi:hypothetical protein
MQKVKQVSSDEFWDQKVAEEMAKAAIDREDEGEDDEEEGDAGKESAAEIRKRLIDDETPETAGQLPVPADDEANKRQKVSD